MAISAPCRLISRARSASPYSASTTDEEPNVPVSTTSQPTSKKERWTWAMRSGRVLIRYLVAALELGTAEVLGAQAQQLQVGAHGAVEDQDALAQRLQVGRRGRVEATEQFRGG